MVGAGVNPAQIQYNSPHLPAIGGSSHIWEKLKIDHGVVRHTHDVVSVVIPAHNQAQVVGRLVRQLLWWAGPDECDVVVVANGCTGNTAEAAAISGRPVRVVSILRAIQARSPSN
jgi:hypothetical protein